MRSALLFIATLALLISACGEDITPGSQYAGQACYVDSDCRGDLLCIGRICTPTGGGGGNNGGLDGGINNGTTDGGTIDDTGLPPDLGGPCDLGEMVCVSDTRRAECITTDDGPRYVPFACPEDTLCEAGRCVGDVPCEDIDGDGYGDGCPAGPDCEDRVASINPGMMESCATPFDDNCNMQTNEGCDEGCCPGGCPDAEFCSAQCVCQPYDPNVCAFQNQPCAQEGIFNNNLYCAPLGDELRCVGLCDKTVPDPNSTCPEPNALCTFGDEQSGVCLSGCDPNIGCGEPGLGCLPVVGSVVGGMCIPTNAANQLGDDCQADIFFDCAEGLLCVDANEDGQGTCEESCRPFGVETTDCSAGSYCLPLSADIGLCFPDNGSVEGERCGDQTTTCGDDAVGCYPSGGAGGLCQRLCRIAEGDADCEAGGRCQQFSPDQNEFGVCRNVAPGGF